MYRNCKENSNIHLDWELGVINLSIEPPLGLNIQVRLIYLR